MRPRCVKVAFVFLLLVVGQVAATERHTKPPGWAITSAHPLATDAGVEIARAGGNAFDAALAVSAALAVVEPMGSGLGGGGFWLLHHANDRRQVMVDGRERAPQRAHRDMYLDTEGHVRPRASLDGPLAAAIPGEPAAIVHIAGRYGRLPLSRTLAPAIRFARNGFPVTNRYQRLVKLRMSAFNPAARQVFLVNGEVPRVGDLIKQPDLASTLTFIARHGHAGFYAGQVAKDLVDSVSTQGGIWVAADLSSYAVVEREPIRGTYRDVEITSAAPPSSGGIVLVAMLNMLERVDLGQFTQVERIHRIVESMRRAYRDRAMYLGDPDFVSIETSRLTSKDYALKLSDDIDAYATPSQALGIDHGEGRDTTHLSILDDEGNRVAATLSINYPFGSGFMVAGTGVLLNNEMDDFVAKAGVANVYGLIGGEANAIAPGKRPLSSMSPTFLETDDAVAVLGTPGGSRIISMVLLTGLAFAEGSREAEQLVKLPRFHHQYIPDQIVFEPGAIEQKALVGLKLKGHQLKPRESSYGNMQVVMWLKNEGQLQAASDPRGEGRGAVILNSSP
jgi:gamma-glutamyltranspeptidase/glutathione hydrolase